MLLLADGSGPCYARRYAAALNDALTEAAADPLAGSG